MDHGFFIVFYLATLLSTDDSRGWLEGRLKEKGSPTNLCHNWPVQTLLQSPHTDPTSIHYLRFEIEPSPSHFYRSCRPRMQVHPAGSSVTAYCTVTWRTNYSQPRSAHRNAPSGAGTRVGFVDKEVYTREWAGWTHRGLHLKSFVVMKGRIPLRRDMFFEVVHRNYVRSDSRNSPLSH